MMGGDLTGHPSPKDRLRLDAFWREVRAFCATGQGGGIDNSCGVKVMSAPDAGGGSGGSVSDWGRSSETEIWTPGKPLFRGSEKIGEIRISRPNEVRELAEAIGVTVPEIFMAAGVAVDSPARVGTGQPRVTVTPFSNVGYINVRWTARGMVTGEGFARGEKQYAGRIGASVDAVECERSISQSKTGGLSVYCSSLFIHPDFQRKGIAFEVVSRVVSSGASEIKMFAAREDSPNPLTRMTGYSTWVKYGFDCPTGRLAFESPDLDDPLEEMKRQFPGVLTLSDLVARPGGAEFWARHGGSNTLWFDTRPRSSSHTTLLDLGDRYKQKQVEGRSMSGGTDCDEDDVINGLWADFTANGLPGNPIDEEYLKSLEKEATDGSSGEVQPH
jgi:GNAT superfamily N-acetyltransferase